MDYTIIGNEVNLAARLQSATEPGSILLSYETNALVQGIVMTEEQPPITVKGFPKPISGYKLVGTYDELVKAGQGGVRGARGAARVGRSDKAEQGGRDRDFAGRPHAIEGAKRES